MGTLVFQANLGGTVNLIGPNTASTVNFTLPSADGTSGQALVTNGSGTLSFSTFTSGAAGSNTQVQFNSSGAFAGSANLTFDGTTLTSNALTVTNATTLSAGTANGVAYLNGSKVVTTGSALTFDGTNFATTGKIGAGGSPGTYTQIWSSGNVMAADGSQIGFLANSAGAPANYMTGSNSSNYLAWIANNSEQMRLTSTGLGIGTSSPGYKLDVNGTGRVTTEVRVKNSAGNVSYLTFEENGNGNSATFISGDARTSGNIGFWTNSAERMRLDASGNLGLGVTPSAWSGLTAFELSAAGSQNFAMYGGGILRNAYYNGSNFIYKASAAATLYEHSAGSHRWYNAASGTAGNAISFTQAMTLDASGNLLVGTTSGGGAGGLTIYPSGGGAGSAAIAVWNKTNTGAETAAQFRVSATTIGSISYSNTAVAFNTTSDYRLKEDIQPMTGALAKVQSLKPVTYNWKADGSAGQGFIAHELQAVVPDCVTGEKDAVDADGNPVYQGIDTSFLVATLTAAIKELKAEFDAYKATHP